MSTNFEATWERYTSSWKADAKDQKLQLFDGCLDADCVYTDPTISTQGWQQLADNMVNFHQQIPGGHFVTTYFFAHSDKSIAKWQMCDGNNQVIGEGISYGEYNSAGQLTAMTGFFEA